MWSRMEQNSGGVGSEAWGYEHQANMPDEDWLTPPPRKLQVGKVVSFPRSSLGQYGASRQHTALFVRASG